jgi:hypothetical protein
VSFLGSGAQDVDVGDTGRSRRSQQLYRATQSELRLKYSSSEMSRYASVSDRMQSKGQTSGSDAEGRDRKMEYRIQEVIFKKMPGRRVCLEDLKEEI